MHGHASEQAATGPDSPTLELQLKSAPVAHWGIAGAHEPLVAESTFASGAVVWGDLHAKVSVATKKSKEVESDRIGITSSIRVRQTVRQDRVVDEAHSWTMYCPVARTRARHAHIATQTLSTTRHAFPEHLDPGRISHFTLGRRFTVSIAAVPKLVYIPRVDRFAIAADLVVGEQRVRVVSVHLGR